MVYHFYVQVHRVFTKGAASFEGTIQRGDSILSINGTSLEGKTHGEVVSCLHQARVCKQALVVICRDEDAEVQTSDRQHSGPETSVCSRRNTSVEAGAGNVQAYIISVLLSVVHSSLYLSVSKIQPVGVMIRWQ